MGTIPNSVPPPTSFSAQSRPTIALKASRLFRIQSPRYSRSVWVFERRFANFVSFPLDSLLSLHSNTYRYSFFLARMSMSVPILMRFEFPVMFSFDRFQASQFWEIRDISFEVTPHSASNGPRRRKLVLPRGRLRSSSCRGRPYRPARALG